MSQKDDKINAESKILTAAQNQKPREGGGRGLCGRAQRRKKGFSCETTVEGKREDSYKTKKQEAWDCFKGHCVVDQAFQEQD